MAKKKSTRIFHRYIACDACGREIVVVKEHWGCPYCYHDNRPQSTGHYRSYCGNSSTGIAMTRSAGEAKDKAGGFQSHHPAEEQ